MPPRYGELWHRATIVRVIGPNFTAGLLIDPDTDRCVFAAPILRHYLNQPADKIRQGFKRLGFKATIVRSVGHERSRATGEA